jgi:hypothetical protein
MTTTEEGQTRPNTSLNEHSLKRRGLFAAAWAVVAAVVLRKGNEPVEATSGTGTDGNFVLGSNDLDNTSNYANHRTQLVPALSFSGTALFESNASPFSSSGSPDAVGVRGGARGTAAGVMGIFGSSVPSGFPAGLNAGVYGVSYYPSNTRGVFGQHLNNGTGVLGQSEVGGIGVQGVIPPTNSGNAQAVYGLNYSNYAGPSAGAGGFGVYGLSAKGHGLVGAVASAGAAAVVGATNGVAGAYAAAFYGPVIVGGDFTVYGAKSAAVPHPDGSHRRLYCVESPESWFEDFGEGCLDCGQADVEIDPDFAAVAETDRYHVFLTQYDQHNDLCVSGQTPTGFRVLAKNGAAAGRFSWRIVAKRKDIAADRFAPVTRPPEPTLPTAL